MKRIEDQTLGRAGQTALDCLAPVVVGTTNGSSVDVGCGTMARETIAYAARFDARGSCLWSTSLVTRDGEEQAHGSAAFVSVDADGNAVVTGGRSGPVILGGRRRDGVLNMHRGFVAHLDAVGHLDWTLDITLISSEVAPRTHPPPSTPTATPT